MTPSKPVSERGPSLPIQSAQAPVIPRKTGTSNGVLFRSLRLPPTPVLGRGGLGQRPSRPNSVICAQNRPRLKLTILAPVE
jgi:hypothetical protein